MECLITVIVPVYQEGGLIYENIKKIRGLLAANDIRYEFIVVDDGSKDNTWDELKRLASDMGNIRAVRLSRNFGKEAALCAGLGLADGDACIVMDSDLQHPPELIPQMVECWMLEGFDVVEGVKLSRGRESPVKRLCAALFYKLLKHMSGIDLNGASDFKLLDRKVLDAWHEMGERTTFFRGMSAWVGFRRKCLPFTVADRPDGKSRWSVFGLVRLAVNAITSYSSAPLQLVTLMGLIFLAGSIVLGLQTLYMKFRGIAFSGFTTVILLLLVIGSTLMISLGIIGTYIARIFDEVKARPRYIVSEVIKAPDRGSVKPESKVFAGK